jgi:Domain of Unknown Function with PDB structure (DUF3857)/Transglutaminase-like superfamily
MNSRLSYNRVPPEPVIRALSLGLSHAVKSRWTILAIAVTVLACALPAIASDAPSWMHALTNVPLPAHDEKTDAVLLYSETNVTIVSTDKIKTVVREAYKILRPQGRELGTVLIYVNSTRKVTSLHGWCIPAQGKDYEVKDKLNLEVAPQVEGGELIDDVKYRVMEIPAPDPGNIIGYEYEVEESPLVLQDNWRFQEHVPVRESRYSLTLPARWEYKAAWLNYPEVKGTPSGSNQWQWVVSDVKAVRKETDMPPFQGVVGQMIISFLPPGGFSSSNGFSNWTEMGAWYRNLTSGRIDPSPDIRQKAAALTTPVNSKLDKMKALAQFVQHDVRYVAIELGIGGWQPHPAADVFKHHYGDCKDKATLMRSMLHEIGVDSYYVVINDKRGSVTPETPAYNGFNHVIIAIKLPEDTSSADLLATAQHPKLGRILFFDPTDELTPFGKISGDLQANFGLLVTPDNGELIELPKQSSATNSIARTAKLTLDTSGRLQGEVEETRVGDRAASQRWALHNVTRESERIKPIESLLAGSLPHFQITKASLVNLQQADQPFGYNYTFIADNYAQSAGNLLLVRPRVLGTKARGILETKEPRQFPIEFEGPVRDTDRFEITLPPGYEIDELPPPVDVDYSFASYHSKTEAKGNIIAYTRVFEVKELSVPVSKAEELKKFYRIIAGDERNTAVLKPMK